MTTRRDALQFLGALAASLHLPIEAVWAEVSARRNTDPLLVRLCDLVIPATDTPGAVAAGVPAFIELCLAHGLRNSSPELLQAFRASIDVRASGTFADLPLDRAVTILRDIDTAAFARGPAPAAEPDGAVRHWPVLKALIVMGYYSSEIGASRELVYELVPGTFEPDVPLSTQPRAFSSDWTGVKYA